MKTFAALPPKYINLLYLSTTIDSLIIFFASVKIQNERQTRNITPYFIQLKW